MNYFRTVGGTLILIAVIALEALFAAGIWYMIGIGLEPALGPGWSYVLATIVAPVVGTMAIVLFVYGHQLKSYILDFEAVNGTKYNKEFKVYFNSPSYTLIVDSMKIFVLAMDTAGIVYRLLLEPISLPGKILLFVVLELLALSPWLIGTLVYIVANRPAAAIRRDIDYIRDVNNAYNELKSFEEGKKKLKAPPTARHLTLAPTQSASLPPAQAVSLSPAQATALPAQKVIKPVSGNFTFPLPLNQTNANQAKQQGN